MWLVHCIKVFVDIWSGYRVLFFSWSVIFLLYFFCCLLFVHVCWASVVSCVRCLLPFLFSCAWIWIVFIFIIALSFPFWIWIVSMRLITYVVTRPQIDDLLSSTTLNILKTLARLPYFCFPLFSVWGFQLGNQLCLVQSVQFVNIFFLRACLPLEIGGLILKLIMLTNQLFPLDFQQCHDAINKGN
jgi:hypothetical protein